MNTAEELGTAPVSRLLVRYATPAIIAMMASSLYNLVDSIFIGHGCGAIALGGLTIAKPFMDICAAFGSLVGVGAGTLVAIKLGERMYETASRILGNVILMNIVISTLVMIPGLIWLDPILLAFGASPATLVPAREYMYTILLGNVFTHLYFGLNNVLRSMGRPLQAMTATILAVTLNTVLDPLFIFGLHMGVRGAALATVLAQVVAVLYEFVLFFDRRQLIHIRRSIWILDRRITHGVLAIGLSPFLMNLAHCFVVVAINNQLVRYGGDMAVAAYGIVFRFTFIFAMFVMGLNQGMQPVVGYNFGARSYARMRRAFSLTAVAASLVMSMVFVLGMAVPSWLARVFTTDPSLIATSVLPCRIICCMMWCVGFQMVTGNFFTSIGRAHIAIFLSLSRQVIFLIPLLFLLPMLFPDPILGVWWAMPLSDGLSAHVAMFFLLRCPELQKK